MLNTALRSWHTPSGGPLRRRGRRGAAGRTKGLRCGVPPGRRVSAGVYSPRQCSFSTLWGLWHTVHTLRTTVVMYSTRMYTCIALGEYVGGDTALFRAQRPHRSLADGAPAGAGAGRGLPVSGSMPRAFQYDSPYEA